MSQVPLQAIASAVFHRPRLWGEALRMLAATAPRGWWRRPPFLPLPDGDYLRWRVATAYGDEAAPVDADDVVAFLAWSRKQRLGRRSGKSR